MNSQNYPELVPAILSDKLEDYISQVETVSKFAKKISLDVMDGKFVQSKSPDVFDILDALKNPDVNLTIHLMTKNPEQILPNLTKYKSISLVCIHVEEYRPELINKAQLPFELGLVINPDTKIEDYKGFYGDFKVIQIMTTTPGSQGPKFQPEALKNIQRLRESGFTGEIHIDGSVNETTIPEILKYQPSLLNIGSAISQAKNPKEAFQKLEEKINEVLKH